MEPNEIPLEYATKQAWCAVIDVHGETRFENGRILMPVDCQVVITGYEISISKKNTIDPSPAARAPLACQGAEVIQPGAIQFNYMQIGGGGGSSSSSTTIVTAPPMPATFDAIPATSTYIVPPGVVIDHFIVRGGSMVVIIDKSLLTDELNITCRGDAGFCLGCPCELEFLNIQAAGNAKVSSLAQVRAKWAAITARGESRISGFCLVRGTISSRGSAVVTATAKKPKLVSQSKSGSGKIFVRKLV